MKIDPVKVQVRVAPFLMEKTEPLWKALARDAVVLLARFAFVVASVWVAKLLGILPALP